MAEGCRWPQQHAFLQAACCAVPRPSNATLKYLQHRIKGSCTACGKERARSWNTHEVVADSTCKPYPACMLPGLQKDVGYLGYQPILCMLRLHRSNRGAPQQQRRLAGNRKICHHEKDAQRKVALASQRITPCEHMIYPTLSWFNAPASQKEHRRVIMNTATGASSLLCR